MSYQYEEIDRPHLEWKKRSHNQRLSENLYQDKVLKNIEAFLKDVDWNNLGSSGTEQSVLDQLSTLEAANADRVTNENTLSGRVDLLEGWNADRVTNEMTATTRINALDTAINQEDGGILDRLGGLESYFNNPDLNLQGLQGELEGMFGAAGEGTKALQALWEEGGAGTSALKDLRDSLNTDWSNKTFGTGDDAQKLNMNQISDLINQQGQTTEGLQTKFTGLFDEGGKGAEAISNIFSDGRLTDAFSDAGLVDSDYVSGAVKGLFDEGGAGTQALEGFEQNVMGQALSDLSSDLVSTYNLDNLDQQSRDIETNIQNITNLTAADTALGNRITGWEDTARQNQTDVATALSDIGGLTTDLATATGDISKLRTDAESWVGDLETASETDRGLIRQELQDKSDLWNQRLTDLSSSMDYKNLGDSATGVRTRKSKARASGQTRFGTGQLNRSMKLTSLNL